MELEIKTRSFWKKKSYKKTNGKKNILIHTEKSTFSIFRIFKKFFHISFSERVIFFPS